MSSCHVSIKHFLWFLKALPFFHIPIQFFVFYNVFIQVLFDSCLSLHFVSFFLFMHRNVEILSCNIINLSSCNHMTSVLFIYPFKYVSFCIIDAYVMCFCYAFIQMFRFWHIYNYFFQLSIIILSFCHIQYRFSFLSCIYTNFVIYRYKCSLILTKWPIFMVKLKKSKKICMDTWKWENLYGHMIKCVWMTNVWLYEKSQIWMDDWRNYRKHLWLHEKSQHWQG